MHRNLCAGKITSLLKVTDQSSWSSMPALFRSGSRFCHIYVQQLGMVSYSTDLRNTESHVQRQIAQNVTEHEKQFVLPSDVYKVCVIYGHFRSTHSVRVRPTVEWKSFASTKFWTFCNFIQETQQSLTNCTTHLCKCNGVADLKTPLPICHHAKFGRSALNGVGINKCWRFGVAVTRWSWSTQLLYIEPG